MRTSASEIGSGVGSEGFSTPGERLDPEHRGAFAQNQSVCRHAEWGATAWGKYHEAQGEDIVPTGNGKRRGRRKKPLDDAIAVENAHEGIIPVELFNRVQSKLPQPKPYQPKRKTDYPLAGLIYCEHCGEPMYGHCSAGRTDRNMSTANTSARPTRTTTAPATGRVAGTPLTPDRCFPG